jgi:hypothetical protein
VEDVVEGLTGGHVTGVKVVLTSVVTALAIYQVFLMAVGYGRLRLPFLGAAPASRTHRAVGDSIVVVTLIIAAMCLSYFGWDESGKHGASDAEETRASIHMFTGLLLIAVISVKIIVVRWWHAMGRFLPALGITVFLLFTITWLTAAAGFLGVW